MLILPEGLTYARRNKHGWTNRRRHRFALRLAQIYMYQPSTIVLAAVNFTRDLQLSLVRDVVNSELASHQRTLGVMMKPVWTSGKDAQESYQVVRNNGGELRLGLGWHVTGYSSFLPKL